MSFIEGLDPWDLNKWTGDDAKPQAVFRHKLSMFLAGLIMLTPHRIAILCANHVVARFHLPPSVVPLFIYKVHNPMELASFIGQLLSTIMTLIIDKCAPQEDPGGQATAKSKSKRVLSCPWNYGILVNNDEDATLDNNAVWQNGQNQWTEGSQYKNNINDKLDEVSQQTTATEAKSKAEDARDSITTAIGGLDSTGAAATTAKDILNKAIKKLEGIGNHTTEDKAAPTKARNWNSNSNSPEGNRWYWHLIVWISRIPYINSLFLLHSTVGRADFIRPVDSSPLEVTTTSFPTRRGASSNYLSLKSITTPGDRGMKKVVIDLEWNAWKRSMGAGRRIIWNNERILVKVGEKMPFNTPVYLNTYKFQDAGAEKEAVFRHKLAMFLTGFIMLTPHRIAVLCAPHLVKRFHLPPSVVPLFIYKIHNPMELASFVGTVMQVLLSAVLFTAIAENQKVRETLAPRWADSAWEFITGVKGSHEDAVITNCKRVASIICGWVMFITSIFTFIFFISGDDYGYLGQFYWSVIIMAFANGIYSSFSFGVNVNAAIYAVGLPLSGFFTFLFHNCCRFLSNKFNWEDYDYTFVKLLIISTMLIQFITASWWTMDQIFQLGNKYNSVGSEAGAVIPNNSSIGELFGLIRNPTTGQKVDANNNNAKQAWSHWSPILMLSISLGTVYAFYPAITPYQLMDVEDANNTDFYIQFISAIPTLVIGILDESGHGPGSKDGYDGDNWYDKPEWNCFWIAAVPYVLCLHIFITMIHFPDGLVSTFLHSRPRLLQAICVSFNFWQEILEIVGFSAAGKQSNRKAVTDNGQADGTPKDQIAYNGHVGMVNNFYFYLQWLLQCS